MNRSILLGALAVVEVFVFPFLFTFPIYAGPLFVFFAGLACAVYFRNIVAAVLSAIAVAVLIAGIMFAEAAAAHPYLATMLAFLLLWWMYTWIRDVENDQVAMRDWFGHIEEKILGPGPHIVPRFFGRIRLRVASTKLYHIQFRKEDNTAFVVRAKEDIGRKLRPVKMWVDAAVFFRIAYKLPKSLKLLFRSNVPLHSDEEMRKWIFKAASKDVVSMLGKRTYPEVMGGKANEELTDEMRRFITDDDSVFVKSGLFGEDVNDPVDGCGEFFFSIEFVHLPDDVSQNINNAENAKLGAEASEHIADADYQRIYGPAVKALPEDEKLSAADVANLRMADLAPGSVQVQRTQTESKIDINSAGQPINPNFAGGLAAAEVIGDAIARAMGKRGPMRPNEGRNKGDGGHEKNTGRGGKAARDAEAYHKKHGEWPEWDPLNRGEEDENEP